MMFLTAQLIASFSIFYLVSSDSLPDAVIDITPLPTKDSTGTKFVYFEETKLNVKCTSRVNPPPQELQMELLYLVAEFNPVFGENVSPDVVRVDKRTLEVEYVPNIFIPLINFTCTAKNVNILSKSTLQVEQLYKTVNVNVLDLNGNTVPKVITLDSDEKVELKCLGDGNPLPQQYQWYNRTKDGDFELVDETEQTLNFVTPSDWPGQSVIVCGAKNKFNKETVKSATVTITSQYFPRPVFTTIPTSYNTSDSNRLVFMEEKQVKVLCSMPTTLPDIYIKIKMESYEVNPVHPQVFMAYEITETPPTISIDYEKRGTFYSTANISCLAINKTTEKIRKSVSIIIDQQHKTQNIVTRGKSEYEVDAGETVRLYCIADGNPKPEYQWYNITKNSIDVAIENATENVFEFITPANWSTAGLYTCAARNKYNTAAIKAKPIPVTSLYYPIPIMITTPPPSVSTSSKFVFNEEPRVVVQCTLSVNPIPDELAVEMSLEGYEENPVYPSTPTGITELPKELQMDIVYDTQRFIPVYNITCSVYNRKTGRRKTTSNIQIEQQYRTTNVVSEVKDAVVDAGDRVVLQCLADGNPKPEYQWYNKTENSGDFKLKNENKQILEFATPYSWSTIGEYTCGAKNKHNLYFKKGKPIQVTSALLPPLEILMTPSPDKSTANNFVYFEKSRINVTCFFPMPIDVPPYVDMDMSYYRNSNEAYNELTPWINQYGNKNNITMVIRFHPNTFVTASTVVCNARNNRKRKTQTKTIGITQQYATKNVAIKDGAKVTLEVGRYKTLTCSADGNPVPNYQWFNETRDGFVTLTNQDMESFRFTAQSSSPRISKFICGARNKYNFEFVMSDVITVYID